LDVVATRAAGSIAVHPRADPNIGEDLPPAVLLVDDRDEDVAIVIAVVERIAAHKVPVPSSRFEADPNIVEANGSCPRFGQTTWYGQKTGPVCRGQHGFGPLTSADQLGFTPILAPATRLN
jgi:hypothetical protein